MTLQRESRWGVWVYQMILPKLQFFLRLRILTISQGKLLLLTEACYCHNDKPLHCPRHAYFKVDQCIKGDTLMPELFCPTLYNNKVHGFFAKPRPCMISLAIL